MDVPSQLLCLYVTISQANENMSYTMCKPVERAFDWYGLR
jgi:hypothetical protein